MPTQFKRRRRRLRPAMLLSLLMLAGLAFMASRRPPSVSTGAVGSARQQQEERQQDLYKRSKPILFFDKGRGKFYHETNMSCPVAWDWTTDEDAADALIYNVLDGVAERSGAARPQRKRPGQKLVFFSLESGRWYPIVYNAKEKGFDLQMDYRLGGPTGAADVPSVYLNNRLVYQPSGDLRAPPKLPKRSDALLSVFVSNCSPRNNRTRVLERLMQLIPVHSYGSCLHNRNSEAQGPNGKVDRYDEKRELAGQYLFGSAMENSDDPGYVTEKVYHALEAGTIPLYLGAPDISRFVPQPEAVVRVSDFPSVEALADYMKAVAADPKKMARHFEWKKREFSPEFQEIQRLAGTSAHCRLAMLLTGTPFKWRKEEVGDSKSSGGSGSIRSWLWP